jgi:RNA polymerase sigma factor (sigma-70 family)
MLGDRQAAQDVVQEAFAGLFRRWAALDDPGRAPAYLRSAVLNRCRNVLRDTARGRALDLVDAVPGATGTAGWGAYGNSAESAEGPVLAAEERRAVLAALRELPPRQREALVLRYFLDQSDAEIARSMGIRPGTVRSATHRGLAALERIMKREAR